MQCVVEIKRGVRCISEADASGYCPIHAKYAMVDSGTHCKKCTKSIRAGTYALKRDDGGLEHLECPPK